MTAVVVTFACYDRSVFGLGCWAQAQAGGGLRQATRQGGSQQVGDSRFVASLNAALWQHNQLCGLWQYFVMGGSEGEECRNAHSTQLQAPHPVEQQARPAVHHQHDKVKPQGAAPVFKRAGHPSNHPKYIQPAQHHTAARDLGTAGLGRLADVLGPYTLDQSRTVANRAS
jgi:hypothetical protein